MTFEPDKAECPQCRSVMGAGGRGCKSSAGRLTGDRDECGDSVAFSAGAYGRDIPRNRCTL